MIDGYWTSVALGAAVAFAVIVTGRAAARRIARSALSSKSVGSSVDDSVVRSTA